MENCHTELDQLLKRTAKESKGVVPPGSPYPNGESLLFMLYYILICFDLADAPHHSPPFSEGAHGDSDAMM